MRSLREGAPLLGLGYLSLQWTQGLSECKGELMWTIFVILLVLWAIGLVSGYTLNNFIHLLLVAALVLLVVNLFSRGSSSV
jgi:hypothetical protein